MHLNRDAQLGKILVEVIGKRVVVINQDNLHRTPSSHWFAGSSIPQPGGFANLISPSPPPHSPVLPRRRFLVHHENSTRKMTKP
jgi:hypothetical protein